jgi:toxin FitB
MSYLLDTCVLSELRKSIPLNVREWFSSKDSDLFFISVVTVAELWDGIECLSASQKRRDLEEWFRDEVHSRFKDRIFSVDDRVAREWGSLNAKLQKKGCMVGLQDIYIAATAKSWDLSLITLNVKDFEHMDLMVINPWA